MQDNVTHVKSEDVFLQPVLQVLKKPTNRRHSEALKPFTEVYGACRRRIASPLADVFDFRELGEEPLLVLSPETFCQVLRQHEVVHCNGQATDVGSLGRHQLEFSLKWERHHVSRALDRVGDVRRIGAITSCSFLSSLLKLSSWPLLRTSGMSCHRAKAEPRDERKEPVGDRLDGDGVPSDPSSLSPSSSWPGSFPCCLWISLLMATSLYS